MRGSSHRRTRDTTPEVDLERDHVRGKAEAVVTLVEYGDFECPYCGQAEHLGCIVILLRQSLV